MTAINPADELMHPVAGEAAWSESYYFNFVDPDSGLAMFTRMGFRPGDGWADALHVVYLGGDRVAFTYGRRDIDTNLAHYNGDLQAGQLKLVCDEPFSRWRILYDGPAQDIADAAILLERSRTRPEGWFKPAHLKMAVTFDALYPPHYAASGSKGHFEQTGRVQGEISIGNDQFKVSGYGVRDKSWGPRDWGAAGSSTGSEQDTRVSAGPAPFVNWFSMNFGPDLAMGGSCFRTGDGSLRGSGWLQREGKNHELSDVVISSRYKPDSILHTDITLQARCDGRDILVEGRVLTVCPTKIPMPGGATFVNEGLAAFECEGRTGYGISEHWHMVRKT